MFGCKTIHFTSISLYVTLSKGHYLWYNPAILVLLNAFKRNLIYHETSFQVSAPMATCIHIWNQSGTREIGREPKSRTVSRSINRILKVPRFLFVSRAVESVFMPWLAPSAGMRGWLLRIWKGNRFSIRWSIFTANMPKHHSNSWAPLLPAVRIGLIDRIYKLIVFIGIKYIPQGSTKWCKELYFYALYSFTVF